MIPTSQPQQAQQSSATVTEQVSSKRKNPTSETSRAANTAISTSPQHTSKPRLQRHKRSVSVGAESTQTTSSIDTTPDVTKKPFMNNLWDYFKKETASTNPAENDWPLDDTSYVDRMNQSLINMRNDFRDNTEVRAKELSGFDLEPNTKADFLTMVITLLVQWAKERVEEYRDIYATALHETMKQERLRLEQKDRIKQALLSLEEKYGKICSPTLRAAIALELLDLEQEHFKSNLTPLFNVKKQHLPSYREPSTQQSSASSNFRRREIGVN